MINGVDRAHMVAVAVLGLTAVAQTHAERCAQNRRLDVMDPQRVARQQRIHPTFADQRRQARVAARMDHYRPGHDNDRLARLAAVAHQRGGLAHCRFHLSFGRRAVGHEGERQPVAFLRLGHHANALHPGHHLVPGANVAQPPAHRRALLPHDQRVHPLAAHQVPRAVATHQGAVVGGRVEILRRAAVALYAPQLRVRAVGGRATEFQQPRQQPLHLLGRRRFHPQPQPRRLGVGPADEEVLHVEVAVKLDHRVEDLLHDVRVDQVTFGFDDFLKRRL